MLLRHYRLFLLIVALALTIASASNWSIKCRISSRDASYLQQSKVQQFVPERWRSFMAAYLWSRAEILMHQGPLATVPQSFQTGSYAGNTDIIPLLQLVILLMPEELAPYQLLSSNLARYLGLPDEGLGVIQQGIMRNREHPAVHELYAAAAFLRLFAMGPGNEDSRRSALKYLTGAMKKWTAKSDEYSSDPAFKPQNYAVLRARLLIELGKPEEALAAWKDSGLNLDAATDRLAEILRDYRDHGRVPLKTDFPGFNGSENESGAAEPDKTPEKTAALPLMPMVRLLTGAGLLLTAVLLWRRRFIRG